MVGWDRPARRARGQGRRFCAASSKRRDSARGFVRTYRWTCRPAPSDWRGHCAESDNAHDAPSLAISASSGARNGSVARGSFCQRGRCWLLCWKRKGVPFRGRGGCCSRRHGLTDLDAL